MSEFDDDGDPAEVLLPPSLIGRVKTRLRKLADWRRDEMLRRLYRNASMLVAGEGFAALLQLASIGLTTRALGKYEWGVLAAVIAYTHLIGSLVKFQTWQAIVKFGADAMARGDSEGLGRLIRFTTALDLGTAILAATTCVATLPLYFAWSNLDTHYQEFALIYSAAALFTVSATPTGILRLFDRFDLLARIPPISAGLRLAGCIIAWYLGGGLWHFGMIWLGCAGADRLLFVVAGWLELKRRGYGRALFGSLRNVTEGHQGLWRFAVAGNLQSSLNALNREVDTLLLLKILGPEAAGLWSLAKRFSAVLSGPARWFLVSVFPQLAKLWAAHDYRLFRRLILRGSATAGTVGILAVSLFAVIGPSLISIIAGSNFSGAYVPTLLLMTSRVVTLFAMPMNPALLAMNRPMKSLKITVVVTVVYLPVLAVLSASLGLLGTGLGRILAETIPFFWLASVVLRTVRRHIERARRLQPGVEAAPLISPGAT